MTMIGGAQRGAMSRMLDRMSSARKSVASEGPHFSPGKVIQPHFSPAHWSGGVFHSAGFKGGYQSAHYSPDVRLARPGLKAQPLQMESAPPSLLHTQAELSQYLIRH